MATYLNPIIIIVFKNTIIKSHDLKKNKNKIKNLKNFVIKNHTKNNSEKYKQLIFKN